MTGTPGRRGWYANLLREPEFTFHLKGSAQVDLHARATAIVDVQLRRDILSLILEKLGAPQDLETWVANSPLVEVALEEGT